MVFRGLAMKRQNLLNIALVVLIAAVVAGVAWVRHEPGGDEPAREDARRLAETQRRSVEAETAVGPALQTARGADPASQSVAFDPGATSTTTASQPEAGAAPLPDVAASQPEAMASSGGSTATSRPDDGSLPRLVDLGSDKCVPCKKMAPILKELKAEYEGRAAVEFFDVWKDPGVGRHHGIRVIPTQIFFDADGKEVWRHEGYLSKEEIVAQFRKMGVK